jgi:hypothetical protein
MKKKTLRNIGIIGGITAIGVFTIFKRTIIIDIIICFLMASMNPPMAFTHSPSDLKRKSTLYFIFRGFYYSFFFD